MPKPIAIKPQNPGDAARVVAESLSEPQPLTTEQAARIVDIHTRQHEEAARLLGDRQPN